VVGLFTLALVLRCAVVIADTGYEPRNDAYDYHRHAVSLASGDGYPPPALYPTAGSSAARGPGYPVALAAVYTVTGDSVTAGRLLGAVLGAVAVLLIYAIVSSIWGRRAGLFAGAIGAIYPPLVLLPRELFNENLYITLVLLAVWLVLRYRGRRQLGWAAAAGGTVGLALLTRNAALALVVPVAIGLWGRPLWSARALLGPAVALACLVVVLGPWTIRNAVEFGRFIPVASSSGITLAGTYNQTSRDDRRFPAGWRNPAQVPQLAGLYATTGLDEPTFDGELRRRALDFIAEHPGYPLEASWHNLLRMFDLEQGAVVTSSGVVTVSGIGNREDAAEKIGLFAVVLLACCGAYAIVRSARRRLGRQNRPDWPPPGPLFLWLIPLLTVLSAAPLGGLPRYRLPADPFLVMAAGIGLIYVWDLLFKQGVAGRVPRRQIGAGAIVLLVAVAGCGGGGNDQSASSPALTVPGTAVSSGISKPEYVRRANAVCRRAVADTRQLAAALATKPIHSRGNPEVAISRAAIEPEVRLLERVSARMRAIPLPAGDRSVPTAYVGLFDVEDSLLHERLRQGLASNLGESQSLQQLALRAGSEQRDLARAYGMHDCDVDYRQVLFSGITGG
jgi:4-amino-4-deoxy-L-arabinose transferase-like glycosyltransferase